MILSATFFPHRVVGAIRITEWCRYLPDFGWDPVVACRYYGVSATPDQLASELNPRVKVRYLGRREAPGAIDTTVPSRIQAAKAMIGRSAVGRMAIPDLGIRYWRTARTQIAGLVAELRPDAVVTSSPPHSIHDVGLWVSTTFKLPWIADFRDPYLIDARYAPRGFGFMRKAAHEAFEKNIYATASLLTHAIPLQARWASRRYPFAKTKIRVLPNGFGNVPFDKTPHSGAPMRICSAGTIGPDNALLVADAVRLLARRGVNIELCLIGRAPPNLPEISQRLGPRLVYRGVQPHSQAVCEIASSHVVLSALDSDRSHSMGLSSKLYEYLAAGRPIVAINPTVPDRQLLGGLSGAVLLRDPSVADLEKAIEWALSPAASVPATQLELVRSTFDRRAQTRIFASWLDALVKPSYV